MLQKSSLKPAPVVVQSEPGSSLAERQIYMYRAGPGMLLNVGKTFLRCPIKGQQYLLGEAFLAALYVQIDREVAIAYLLPCLRLCVNRHVHNHKRYNDYAKLQFCDP